MSALGRWLAVFGTASVITLVAALAPFGFRHMDAFRVQRVEVSGARYMSPQAALAATGITDSSSVFDDLGDWADGLRSERLVAEVRVHRRLPGTLRIDLVEAEPIALVRTPALRPVDARGRLLPIELAGQDMDVPVIIDRTSIGEDSVVDAGTARLIAGLLDVRSRDAGLAGSISEVGYAPGGGLVFILRSPRFAEVLLPEAVSERTMQQIRLAMDHLRSEDREAGSKSGALERLARIDARYADELFVTLRSPRAN